MTFDYKFCSRLLREPTDINELILPNSFTLGNSILNHKLLPVVQLLHIATNFNLISLVAFDNITDIKLD